MSRVGGPRARWPYIAVLTCAVAQGCSFFIPFDDYPGTSSSDAAVLDTGAPEAETDASGCTADADTRTDPNNCGACGRVCVEGTGSCVDGKCPVSVVYDGDGGPTVNALVVAPSVDVDGGSDLYITTGNAFIVRKSLTSDVIERLPTKAAARALAVSRGLGLVAIGSKSVETFDVTSLDAGVFVTLAGGRIGLGPVALLGTTAVWGENAGTFFLPADGGVMGGQVEAGAAEAVAFRTSRDVATWVASNGAVQSVRSQSLDTVTTLLPPGSGTFTDLEVSAKYLYLCRTSGLVAAQGGVVLYTTSNPPTLYKTIGEVRVPQAIVLSSSHVYIADGAGTPTSARVWRARDDGTQVIVVADQLESPRAVAVDGPWLYFNDGPRVLRTSK